MNRTQAAIVPLSVFAPLWAGGAEPVDMRKRAAELKEPRWGIFICWSFHTFSGREWTPGVKDVVFFKAADCDTVRSTCRHSAASAR